MSDENIFSRRVRQDSTHRSAKQKSEETLFVRASHGILLFDVPQSGKLGPKEHKVVFNVLLMEPSAKIRQQVQDTLQWPEYNVITVDEEPQAVQTAVAQPIHLIVLGTAVPDSEGIMERLCELPGMGATPLIMFLFSPNQPINMKRIGRFRPCYLSYSGFSNKEFLAYVKRLLGLDGYVWPST